jgi:hypothetical protein
MARLRTSEAERFARRAPAVVFFVVLFVVIEAAQAFAQEPPLTIPAGGPSATDPNAIAFSGWQLYPSVDVVTEHSNNYFLSSPKISGWALGISPRVTAEWSNGIHSTTLYGQYDHFQYPTQNQVNSDDGETTWTQRYAPLRDLAFTFVGDYSHQTISPSLTSSIPAPVTSTATTVLPNGNTVLPNGTLVSPSGQIIGQAALAPSIATTNSVVDPYDSLTGSARVDKIFNGGIMSLSASLMSRSYEKATSRTEDFNAKTFTEDLSVALGPLLYAYSDGTYSARTNTPPSPDSSAYRVIGGLGTRQIGLFRASVYVGHQGSEDSGAGSAGGNVYGGTVTYYPTDAWTIRGNVDETINVSSETGVSTQALSLPIASPVQVPLNSNATVTSFSLASDYQLSPQWGLTGLLGYSRVAQGLEKTDSTWLDAVLRYDIKRNLSLFWEYQFSSIVSNVPGSSASRNLVSMRASYRF